MSETMGYVPDDLEVCPDHPTALIRRTFDEGRYVWPDGRTGAPTRRNTRYECAACLRELKMTTAVTTATNHENP